MNEKLRKMLENYGVNIAVGSIEYWQNEIEMLMLDMYEEGQVTERKLNAKLCNVIGDKIKNNDNYAIGAYACSKAISQGVLNEPSCS